MASMAASRPNSVEAGSLGRVSSCIAVLRHDSQRWRELLVLDVRRATIIRHAISNTETTTRDAIALPIQNDRPSQAIEPRLFPMTDLFRPTATRRLLYYRGDRAFLYDDHDDRLLIMRVRQGLLPQLEKSHWLAGQRLQSARLSSDNRVLFGWDNRHNQLHALAVQTGKSLGRTSVTANNIFFD